MRIDSSGNVGIGTTSPARKVHLHESTSGNNFISFTNSTTGSTSGDGILVGMDSDESLLITNKENNHIAFATNNTERMRLDSSGRLLVGTTTEGFATYGDKFTIANSGHCGMTIRSGTSHYGTIYFSDADDGSANEVRGFLEYYHSTNALSLGTDGAPRLRIDSFGNVGIGTTSPGNILDVQGSSHSKILIGTTGTGHATGLQISHALGNAALQQWQLQTDATADGNLVVRNATTGNKVMIFDSDNYGVSIGGIDPEKMFELGGSNNTKTDPLQANNILRFRDNDSTTTNGQPFGTITWTTNDGGHEGVTGYISCESTNNDGEGRLNFAAGLEADGTLTEVMHCDKEGVLIGGTGLGGDFGPEALRVNATAGTGIQIGQHNSTSICLRTNRSDARATYTAVQWNAQGVGVGSVVVNHSSTNYNTSSDYRIKENVVNLENAISRIKNLKPYRFNFIGDTSETIDGFFAHEAAEVVPNAVTGEKDAVKDGKIDAQSIDNSKLVPLLVAALQEAIGRIEVLEAK